MNTNTARTLSVAILAAALVAVVYILYKKGMEDNKTKAEAYQTQLALANIENNPSDRKFAMSLANSIGNGLSGIGGAIGSIFG